MYRLRKSITFEAAHHLPDHDGVCRNLHGHTYTVEAFVCGRELVPINDASHPSRPDEGMLIDFKVLSFALKSIHAGLDHTDLTESAPLYLGIPITTAEHLARGIFYTLQRVLTKLNGEVAIEKVRVWETKDSYAEYERGDLT